MTRAPSVWTSRAGEERRSRAAAAIRAAQEIVGRRDGLVLVAAGEVVPVPGGLDRVHPFESHPHYFWLSGGSAPGSFVAFDSATDEWAWFEPAVTDDERLWEGATGERDGAPIAELGAWLAARRGRPVAVVGGDAGGMRGDSVFSMRVDEHLLHARRAKDAVEIDTIRGACEITAAGHARAASLIADGCATERSIAIEIDHAFRAAGGDGPGYATIVGAGRNASVLHASPGMDEIVAGSTVLVDAGASSSRYTGDVSRVYPCGAVSDGARALVGLVERVQANAVDACQSGVEFTDLHDRTVIAMLRGLSGLGLVRGDADDLLKRGVGRLFMPHGLGHLVGLGVRDATGGSHGRPHRISRAGVRVRLDAALEPGWVVTVEPGCYFIEPLLVKAQASGDLDDAVDFDRVAELSRDIAGVRIEDNVLVTAGEPTNLTSAIPKFSDHQARA